MKRPESRVDHVLASIYSFTGRFSRPVRGRLRTLDPALYAFWSAWIVLASARLFYGSMFKQTGIEWSAPLDDVFIHFDYARATAEGHPFEWVSGNGYSSGNTSLLYPFVLAAGWLAGFRDVSLMMWAAIVAAFCTFGLLLAVRPLFFSRTDDDLGRAGSYLAPMFLLGVGALDWSLWSGMEVALYLGLWAIALVVFLAADRRVAEPVSSPRWIRRLSWALGITGLFLVATRPEAVGTIGVFGIALALRERKRSLGAAFGLLVRVGLPGAVLVIVQAFANRHFTGETSANGAIVKLALNSPFLTADEKIADYIFNLKYALLRPVEYHFADHPAFGMIAPVLALFALADRKTRRIAVILWAQIALWLLLVSANGQVRWQNERYVMPAVAWLLLCAALGAVALVRRTGRPNPVFVAILGALAAQAVAVAVRPPGTAAELQLPWLAALPIGAVVALVFWFWPVRVVLVAALLFLGYDHQVSKMRDQKWFFGRACRNIRDQQLTMGRWLKDQKPRRILVGDAGAILYTAERPGLDIIGLGGYHAYPFARAGVHGLPATIELIERMPKEERPDVLAIFPTWWGVLPVWFGPEVLKRFPVEGNVICGGYEHVAYRADWHLLGTGEAPRLLPEGDLKVRDAIDVADLVSEKEHRYVFPRPGGGWTDMRILPDPANEQKDLFDGGRRIAAGRAESFVVGNLTAGKGAHLVFRTAPEGDATIRVKIDGQVIATEKFDVTGGWVERAVAIPPASVREQVRVEVVADGPTDFVDYHVWLTQ